jgi:NADPH:quinone reductase-like Zn-dependent oxidoreductase
MKGIQLTGYGNPAEVVKLVHAPDVGAPGPDEVLIDIEAAPVEPSDLYTIAGIYGILPPLPHFLGIQGVGRVSAVGRKVKHLKEGDRTITPLFTPSWVEQVKTNSPWLRALPDGDVNQLAMLGINPATAWLMLTEFVQLKPGDWLLQNAANASVGRAVIAIAKSRGIKTVNLVRSSDLVGPIEALGGDVVLVDGEDLPRRVAEATDKAPIRLALDGVGDSATQRLLNSIAPFGTVIVWSGMSGKPFTASGPQLLFRDHTIRGMWIHNWNERLCAEKMTAIYSELTPLVASGELKFPVAGQFTFDQYGEALDVAARYNGKAILTPRR